MADSSKPKTCSSCKGEGKQDCHNPYCDVNCYDGNLKKTCTICNGTKKVTCKDCDGNGKR